MFDCDVIVLMDYKGGLGGRAPATIPIKGSEGGAPQFGNDCWDYDTVPCNIFALNAKSIFTL